MMKGGRLISGVVLAAVAAGSLVVWSAGAGAEDRRAPGGGRRLGGDVASLLGVAGSSGALSSTVRAVPGAGEVAVTWDRGGLPSVLYYLVYRGEGRDPNTSAEPFEMVKGLRFVDTQVVAGTEYRYAVVPVGIDGRRGAPSGVATARARSAAGPRIAKAIVDPAGRVLKPGDVVTVAVAGTSGARASAELGRLTPELVLREKGRTGRYQGSYVVKDKDVVGARRSAHAVVVRLADGSGAVEVACGEVTVAGRTSGAPPVISRASHDSWKVAGFSGKLVAGDVLTVTAEGQQACSAVFELSGLAGTRRMREVRPGTYVGSYTVRWEDRVDEVRVAVRLIDADGNEAVASAGRPVAFDTRVRLTVAPRDSVLPADGRSQTRVVVHAANANGDEVAGHEIAVSVVGGEEVSGGAGRKAAGGGTVTRLWDGSTDAFGDVTATFVAGRAAGMVLLLAKDLSTTDVGVGWIATGDPEVGVAVAARQPRAGRAGREKVAGSRPSAPELRAGTPSAPSEADLRVLSGAVFVPRFYEGQEHDRVRLKEWLVKPGRTLERGQAVAIVDTPSGPRRLLAPEAGVLARGTIREGERVALGQTVAYVEIDEEVWKSGYRRGR